MRRLISLAATAAVAVTMVFALPAHAAGQSYSWTGMGTDHTFWSNPQNWAPNGVPGNGDSVTVGSLPGGPSDITEIPTVSLSSLTLNETANNVYLDGAAANTLTVTQSLSWSGGDVSVPLTLAAGATGVITGQGVSSHLDSFGGGTGSVSALKKFTIAGHLTITGVGIDQYLPTLRLSGADDIVVAAGGTLTTTANTLIQSGECCVDHTATLQNFGTIAPLGALEFMYLGLDQNGVFNIPAGQRVQFYSGPIRSQGTSAKFSGGGTFEMHRDRR